MTLVLTIENLDRLPDGGPLSVSLSGRRGIDIGRDQYLDWTLPDPDRVISGKHAEIRHRDGGYWLQDVSRNGTFLNRSGQRLQEACRLRDGDRIEIGRYVIRVAIEGEAEAAAPAPMAGQPAPGDVWEGQGESAPPIPSRDLRPPAALRPVRPDFIDWAVDLPTDPGRPAVAPARSAPGDGMDWARATPEPLPPPPPPMPSPRRATPPVEDAPAIGRAGAGGWSPPPSGRDTPGPGEDDPWGAADLQIAAPAARRHAVEDGIPREPPPPPPQDRAAPVPRLSESAGDAFVRRFAAGLGVSPEILSWQDPEVLAEEAGALLRLSAESLKQLLAARAESKRTAKASSQTTIQALDNNPLKFAPTADDALRIMFGPPSSGYLEARRAMEMGFRDLKAHQIKTYAAMQNAVRLLLEELSPDGVEASDEGDRGLGGLLGSRKARLWDLYATRWATLASPHEDGMVDAFMIFFADCYDRNR